MIGYYQHLGALCIERSHPQAVNFRTVSWICIADISDRVKIYAYIMSQEGILNDIKQFGTSGGIPMQPRDSDPKGETVIVIEISVEHW
ncbi:hypothetical protein HC928_09825 [bacterium]|nr:hypothetical protein [bacterium]